jgi:hypothetical protein
MKRNYLTLHSSVGSLLLLAAPLAHAVEITFDAGGNGTSWNDSDNWSPASPTASDHVVISASASTPMTLSSDFTIQDLTVATTASTVLQNSGGIRTLILSGTRSGTDTLIHHTGSGEFRMSNASSNSFVLDLGSVGEVKVADGASVALLNTVRGSGGIIKTGEGALFIGLSTVSNGLLNNYSGGFILKEGLVRTNLSSTAADGVLTRGPFGVGTLRLEGGWLRSGSSTTRLYHNNVQLAGSVDFGGSDTGQQTFSAAMGGSTTLDANSTVNALGTVIWNQSITAASPAYNLDKAGVGTLTVAGGGTWNTSTISGGQLSLTSAVTLNSITIETGGTLSLGTGGSISGGGGTVILAGGSFAAGTSSVANLSGEGSVSGTLTITNSMSVGNSPGTIGFTNLTLAPTTTAIFEILGGDTVADLGNVSGQLDLGGATLDLVQLGTYTLGDKFTLFSYGSLSGTFAGLAQGDTFAGGAGMWSINYVDDTAGLNGGTGSNFVTITAIPEPRAALLGAFGLILLLGGRRRVGR